MESFQYIWCDHLSRSLSKWLWNDVFPSHHFHSFFYLFYSVIPSRWSFFVPVYWMSTLGYFRMIKWRLYTWELGYALEQIFKRIHQINIASSCYNQLLPHLIWVVSLAFRFQPWNPMSWVINLKTYTTGNIFLATISLIQRVWVDIVNFCLGRLTKMS